MTMHDDPIAMALRRDAELLREQAPPINVAEAWHRMRAEHAARLRRALDYCGWAVRFGLMALLAAAAAIAPRTALALLPALALLGWLTSGLCTPLGRAHWPRRGIWATPPE
jgi:hypothetical protein